MAEQMDSSEAAERLRLKFFVPRLWFLFGFGVLFLLSFIQTIIVSVNLDKTTTNNNDDEKVEKTSIVTSCIKGDKAIAKYEFDYSKQEWANALIDTKPPGFDNVSWQELVESAEGTTVTWAAMLTKWGSNSYGTFLKEQLKKKYNINLNVIDINRDGAPEDRSNTGTYLDYTLQNAEADFLWMNGPNWKKLVDSEKTWGPYANIIPNARLFDWEDKVITTDFGLPTEFKAMPFHLATFLFAYVPTTFKDEGIIASLDEKPKLTMKQLLEHITNKKVKVTLPSPKADIGMKFYEVMYLHYLKEGLKSGDLGDEYEDLFERETLDENKLDKLHEYVDTFITDGITNGVFVAKDDTLFLEHNVIQEMFLMGEVTLSWELAPGRIVEYAANTANGITTAEVVYYPADTQGFVLDEKIHVSNTNYLTIQQNAPNKAGALVAINLASSLEHQYKRFFPHTGGWKAVQAFNPSSPLTKNTGWDTVFNEVEDLEGVPTYEELSDARVPEVTRVYYLAIQEHLNKKIDDEVFKYVAPAT